jgi:hypothetical protein
MFSKQPDIKQSSMSLVSIGDESAFDKRGDSPNNAVRLSGCETKHLASVGGKT